MNTLKQKSLGFYANILIIVMTVVSLAIYVMNVNMPYYEDLRTDVILMLIGAILALAVTTFLKPVNKSKFIQVPVDLLRVAASVLIIWAGVTFVSMRVESFGYIFGSNLEMGNDAAFEAAEQAVLLIIIFVITWLLSIITSFFDVRKHVR